MLFNPSVAGLEMDGCGEMIFKCITVIDKFMVEMLNGNTKIIIWEYSYFRRYINVAWFPNKA